MKKEKYEWEEKRSGRLDFLDTSSESATEEMILEYLAEIITDIYLKGIEKKDIV